MNKNKKNKNIKNNKAINAMGNSNNIDAAANTIYNKNQNSEFKK